MRWQVGRIGSLRWRMCYRLGREITIIVLLLLTATPAWRSNTGKALSLVETHIGSLFYMPNEVTEHIGHLLGRIDGDHYQRQRRELVP